MGGLPAQLHEAVPESPRVAERERADHHRAGGKGGKEERALLAQFESGPPELILGGLDGGEGGDADDGHDSGGESDEEERACDIRLASLREPQRQAGADVVQPGLRAAGVGLLLDPQATVAGDPDGAEHVEAVA